METAGYIIIGAIAERVSFAGLPPRRDRDGRRSSTRSTATGCGAAAGWPTSASRCTGATARSTSPARGWCTRTGGWAALALAMVLGPRIGKFNKDGTPNAIPGHNIAFVVVGTLILVFGWMGFNPGSTFGATDLRISVVAVNTLLAVVLRLRVRHGVDGVQVRQARHLDVVQRDARRSRRDHRAVRLRRTVGGVHDRRRSPGCSCAAASGSSTTSPTSTIPAGRSRSTASAAHGA